MAKDPTLPVDEEARALAKRLMRTARSGALATNDAESGMPFASLVQVGTDLDGSPIILTSQLSVHTKLMEADPHTQGLKAWHFIKASRALADPGATVKISGVSDQVDWEVELVAVIGRAAKNVPEDKALDYVAGYTAANDLSARDRGRRANISDTSPFKADWTKHKTFDGSCPLGPWIVPASDIGDPQNLGLKLWVNDVLKQDSNSKDMIFNLAEQIAQLSSGMTLHPGDLVLTGTPAGVGSARGEFLKPGDVVKIWIEKIGTLSNKMA